MDNVKEAGRKVSLFCWRVIETQIFRNDADIAF